MEDPFSDCYVIQNCLYMTAYYRKEEKADRSHFVLHLAEAYHDIQDDDLVLGLHFQSWSYFQKTHQGHLHRY